MKCQRCNGVGKYKNAFGDIVRCDRCYGTGEVEYGENDRIFPVGEQKPLTNEEYIRSCSTEELAKLIYKIAVTDVLMDRFFTAEIVNAEIVNEHIGIKEAEAWLKEKHHAN